RKGGSEAPTSDRRLPGMATASLHGWIHGVSEVGASDLPQHTNHQHTNHQHTNHQHTNHQHNDMKNSRSTHMTTTFNNAAALEQAIGQSLGATEWITIDQQRVDTFAEATGDHQWIHVDPEKARTGPFGGTIAHGYLTLSLVNYFLPQLM